MTLVFVLVGKSWEKTEVHNLPKAFRIMIGKHWQRQGLRQKNNDDFGPEKTKRNDEEQIRLFLSKLQQNLKKIPQVPQTSPI